MFKYTRILVLLMVIAVVISSGCTPATQPHLGKESGLKDVPNSKRPPKIIF